MRKYTYRGELMKEKNHNAYNVFSSNIKMYRKNLSLTQEQLAEKSNCSSSYIKQIESNKEYKNVSLSTIINICNALDISVAELFTMKSQK